MDETRIIEVLRMGFSRERKILQKAQAEIKVGLKNFITQVGNSKESLTKRMNQ